MKFSRKQIEFTQLGVAAFVVFISALLSADPVRTPLGLWFGALWLLLAWKFGLSPIVMALMVFLSLRSPVSVDLPARWFVSINLGISAFTLSMFFRTRWSAVVSALLWGSVMAVSPLLLFPVLAGIPRFGKMHGEQVRVFVWPALLLGVGLAGYFMYTGSLDPVMERPFDDETYAEIAAFFLSVFSVESLWRFLPMVGIFEVVQKQPDDHKLTWKNLFLFGALFSMLVVPLPSFVQMWYLMAFPLTSMLLIRWGLALPDLISRAFFCVGMVLLAFPFLQGGLS